MAKALQNIFIYLALSFLTLFCTALNASDDELAKACLKRYYPQIQDIIDNEVIMQDGSVFIWDDGLDKSYMEALNNPDLQDSFSVAYPLQGHISQPHLDTSRIRHTEFFKYIYGTDEDSVKQNLTSLEWLKEWFDNYYIIVNMNNGVASAFVRVIEKLEQLPQSHYQFLKDADVFYWRNIADSNNLSPHSFGIAIDINTAFSKYWLWDKKEREEYKHENQIPLEIIQAFESEGFIWGGRWWHYDTMHFEYRPEIICYAKNLKE